MFPPCMRIVHGACRGMLLRSPMIAEGVGLLNYTRRICVWQLASTHSGDRRRCRAAVAFELSIKRLAIETQYFCGLRFVAADSLEHAQNVSLLDLIHRQKLGRILRIDDDARRAVIADFLREIIDRNLLEARERDRTFHAVLQLTYV